MPTIVKLIAYLALAFILLHWFTAGQDNIIEGPPETPDGVHSPVN